MDMAPVAVTLQIWTVQHRGFIVPAGTDLRPSLAHPVKEEWSPEPQQYGRLISAIRLEIDLPEATAHTGWCKESHQSKHHTE